MTHCCRDWDRLQACRHAFTAITLEAGAWYEVEGAGVHQAVCAGPGVFRIGGLFFDAHIVRHRQERPSILRRVYISDTPTADHDCGRYDLCKSRTDRYWKNIEDAIASEPFRLSGPGWYKTRGGSWVKNPQEHRDVSGGTDYAEDGRYLPGSPYKRGRALDLIARATPAQEKILEAL